METISLPGGKEKNPYKQTGSSHKCPCQPSSHPHVLGWSPQRPFTHPGNGMQTSQESPSHPEWHLKNQEISEIQKCYLLWLYFLIKVLLEI